MSRPLLLLLPLAAALGCQQFPSYTVRIAAVFPPRMESRLPERMKIAVIPVREGPVRSGAASRVASLIEQFLIEDPRYSILEREALKGIMQERELAETGLLEREPELRAKARMKGADALVFVRVTGFDKRRIRITRRERVHEHRRTAVWFGYRSRGKTRIGVVPVHTHRTRVVPRDYFAVKADVEVVLKMVNVATSEQMVTKSSAGSWQSELVRERPPEVSEAEAVTFAVKEAIKPFMREISWVGDVDVIRLPAANNRVWDVANKFAARGAWERAAEQYRRALHTGEVRRSPHAMAAVHYCLGVVCEAQGLWREALQEYDAALKLDPGSEALIDAAARAQKKMNGRAEPREIREE